MNIIMNISVDYNASDISDVWDIHITQLKTITNIKYRFDLLKRNLLDC